MLASIRDDRETLTRQLQGKLSNLRSLGQFSTQRIVMRMGVQSCRFQARVTDNFFSDERIDAGALAAVCASCSRHCRACSGVFRSS